MMGGQYFHWTGSELGFNEELGRPLAFSDIDIDMEAAIARYPEAWRRSLLTSAPTPADDETCGEGSIDPGLRNREPVTERRSPLRPVDTNDDTDRVSAQTWRKNALKQGLKPSWSSTHSRHLDPMARDKPPHAAQNPPTKRRRTELPTREAGGLDSDSLPALGRSTVERHSLASNIQGEPHKQPPPRSVTLSPEKLYGTTLFVRIASPTKYWPI